MIVVLLGYYTAKLHLTQWKKRTASLHTAVKITKQKVNTIRHIFCPLIR